MERQSGQKYRQLIGQDRMERQSGQKYRQLIGQDREYIIDPKVGAVIHF